MRSLSPDEAELWAKVAATIRPLSREPISFLERAGGGGAALTTEPSPARRPRHQPASGPPPRDKLGEDLGSRTLDSTWNKRLRSGAVEPDRILDLHGMSLDRAWRAIDGALERAIRNGERVLLLITGHHRPGTPPVERGKIRAAVHDWLAHSRHAPRIAAVRGAHRRHGGGGSLYLVLRRG